MSKFESIKKILLKRHTIIFAIFAIIYSFFPWHNIYNDAFQSIHDNWFKLPILIREQIPLYLYALVFLSAIIYYCNLIWYFLYKNRVNVFLMIVLFLFLLGGQNLSSSWKHSVRIVLGFIVFFIVFRNWGIRSEENKPGLDEELSKLEDDRLERVVFSNRILDIVDRTRFEKIAITGPWGSGKTTCLKFIEKLNDEKKKAVVVNFSPWKYSEKNQMWNAFVGAVDASIANYHGIEFGPLQQNKLIRWLVNLAHVLTGQHSVGRLFEILLGGEGEGQLEKTKNKLAAIVQRELGKTTKIILLIDDLDRCLPDTVFELIPDSTAKCNTLTENFRRS